MTLAHAVMLFVLFAVVGCPVGFVVAVLMRPKEPDIRRFFRWWGAVWGSVAGLLSLLAVLFVAYFASPGEAVEAWGPIFGTLALAVAGWFGVKAIFSRERAPRPVTPPAVHTMPPAAHYAPAVAAPDLEGWGMPIRQGQEPYGAMSGDPDGWLGRPSGGDRTR